MSYLNTFICMNTFHQRLLLNFKNVIRLKRLVLNPMDHQSDGNSFCTFSTFGERAMFRNLDYSLSNSVTMSRWTKTSGTSSNSKRRRSLSPLRNGSLQFAEKCRVRFQDARGETKRKVQKKIVEIKENILTIPNGLCVLRILSTPFLGYLVLTEFYTVSLGLFICAGFTDVVDGYIARNFPNQQSMIGSFLDPAADKFLIATLFVTLTANGLIPIPLTFLILFRDACLFGAGFYIRYVSLPPPKTLSRYFDMSFATASLSPTTISKINTFLQLSLVAVSLAAPVFSYVDHLYLQILWYVTGTTTVISAASYLYYNHSTYKLMIQPDKSEK